MSEETVKPRRVRKCAIGEVLGPQLLAMITSNPESPQFRAMLLQRLLVPVPDECRTIKQVTDWIEFNIDPLSIRTSPQINHSTIRAPAQREGNSLALRITTSEEEYGTCHYSCTSYGRARFSLDADEIADAAEGCETVEQFKVKLRELIDENVWENVESTDCDGYDHDDYESTSHDNGSWEMEGGTLDGVVNQALEIIRGIDMDLYRQVTGT